MPFSSEIAENFYRLRIARQGWCNVANSLRAVAAEREKLTAVQCREVVSIERKLYHAFLGFHGANQSGRIDQFANKHCTRRMVQRLQTVNSGLAQMQRPCRVVGYVEQEDHACCGGSVQNRRVRRWGGHGKTGRLQPARVRGEIPVLVAPACR